MYTMSSEWIHNENYIKSILKHCLLTMTKQTTTDYKYLSIVIVIMIQPCTCYQ